MTKLISLSDPLFETADELAEHLGISRDQLYENALKEYMRERHSAWAERLVQKEHAQQAAQGREKNALRERFDAVYAKEDSVLDPLFAQIQARSLPPQDEW